MAAPPAPSDQRIGKYRLERLLGSGGMGHVYAAVHELLGKRVALKILNPEWSQNQVIVNRFFDEAKAAASLCHLNIVDVVDFDRHSDGRFYMVLEYLEGESLEEYLGREGAIAPAEALAILAPIASALDVAHAKGIVHRDIKPANLFLSRRPGADRLVKILDFGIAKLLTGSTHGVTQSGTVLGTVTYMSPEQALGKQKRIGPPSDVYSVGVVAFEMLCGRVPFHGAAGELVIRHAQEAPPVPSRLRKDLPPGLDPVIARALAKRPHQRWQSVGEFSRAFELALDPARSQELAATLATTIGDSTERLAPALDLLSDDREPGNDDGEGEGDGDAGDEPRKQRNESRGDSPTEEATRAGHLAVRAIPAVESTTVESAPSVPALPKRRPFAGALLLAAGLGTLGVTLAAGLLVHARRREPEIVPFVQPVVTPDPIRLARSTAVKSSAAPPRPIVPPASRPALSPPRASRSGTTRAPLARTPSKGGHLVARPQPVDLNSRSPDPP